MDVCVQGGAGEAEFLTRGLEKRGVDAISLFLREHHEELQERFSKLGLNWDTVLQPEWQRAITRSDMDNLRWTGEAQ